MGVRSSIVRRMTATRCSCWDFHVVETLSLFNAATSLLRFGYAGGRVIMLRIQSTYRVARRTFRCSSLSPS